MAKPLRNNHNILFIDRAKQTHATKERKKECNLILTLEPFQNKYHRLFSKNTVFSENNNNIIYTILLYFECTRHFLVELNFHANRTYGFMLSCSIIYSLLPLCPALLLNSLPHHSHSIEMHDFDQICKMYAVHIKCVSQIDMYFKRISLHTNLHNMRYFYSLETLCYCMNAISKIYSMEWNRKYCGSFYMLLNL